MLHLPTSLPRSASVLVAVLLVAVAGCGGGKEESTATTADEGEVSPVAQAMALDAGPRAFQEMQVEHVRADRGADLFEAKSCADCHVLGEADMSPDPVAAVERRTRAWLVRQISDPEWMIAHDPVTQALVQEHDLEMLDTGVTPDEAEDIVHHLLRTYESTLR